MNFDAFACFVEPFRFLFATLNDDCKVDQVEVLVVVVGKAVLIIVVIGVIISIVIIIVVIVAVLLALVVVVIIVFIVEVVVVCSVHPIVYRVYLAIPSGCFLADQVRRPKSRDLDGMLFEVISTSPAPRKNKDPL